jgi:ATP-dependent protease ClpP protease subunit
MKNTRLMMTQPMGGSQGDIYAIAETVKELNAIYQVRGGSGGRRRRPRDVAGPASAGAALRC